MRPITTLVQEVRSQPPRMPGLSEALPLEPWTRQSRKDDGQELSGGAKYESVDKPINASPGRPSRKSTCSLVRSNTTLELSELVSSE